MNKIIFMVVFGMSLSVHSEETESEKLDGVFDKNSDGVADVFYEYAEDGSYIELVDSNYDNKVDERCEYNSNDTLVNCSYDQNFDGYEETKIEYDLGMPTKEGVDTNENRSFDIVFKYKSGVLYEGFKYYSNKGGKRMIGHVKFEYGYPLPEKFLKTTLSEKEFSEAHWTKKE